MKKLIAIMLSLVMVLGLVVCAPANEDNGSENSNDTVTNEQTFTTVESGKLIMATNAAFPPYEYIEGNEIVGIDAEIAKAIADKLGLNWLSRTWNLIPSLSLLRAARPTLVWLV